MSYLSPKRVSFCGRFLSDVPTRNNSDDNFVPGATQVDYWNALGGSSVELLDCRTLLAGVVEPGDPATDFVVTGAVDAPSGKMVDLDPDWQMSSELWGMRLRVADRSTGELAVEGRMTVCAFRDLWTRQVEKEAPNRQAAGGRYVSTLTHLVWGSAADKSPAMNVLRAAAATSGKLSVGWHVFGYFYTETHARHRTGTVMVHLGPHGQGEPQTALVHRRVLGYSVRQEDGKPLAITGNIDFAVADGGRAIHLDVGHALKLADPDGTLLAISDIPGLGSFTGLFVGLLPSGSPSPGVSIAAEHQVRLLDLPDDPEWYRRTGGVVSVDVPEDKAAAVDNLPLGLFAERNDGVVYLVAKETENGIFYRTDTFVSRLDPGDTATVMLHARRFGRPLAGLRLHVVPGTPLSPASTTEPTDAEGKTEVSFEWSDPGEPRRDSSLDGQIYVFRYCHELSQTGMPSLVGTGLERLDVIVVHVRDRFVVPAEPEFERDIEPFMAQYAQLYPIMSQHLFDIADYDALVSHRRAMLLAFSRDINDPNYMPVTRDMSKGRIATLVKWLSSETSDPAAPLRRSPGFGPFASIAARETPFTASAEGADTKTAEVEDVKTAMARVANRGTHLPVIPLSTLEG